MRRLVIAVVAAMVIGASLVSLRSRVGSPTSRIKRDPYIGLGQAVADESVQLVNGHGRIGVVIADYYQDKDNPMASVSDAFRNELKRHPSIELAATEIIPSNEITPESAVSVERFHELMIKHAALNGMVFLVGLPVWDAKKPFDLPPAFPKIVATPGPRRPLKQYFTSGLVNVLIVPRLSGGPDPKFKPKTPREWFDMLYEVYTKQNFESLPEE